MFDRPNLERGWAIPCATDIAFSYLAARIVFGAKHPAIPFLLLLAIADDALGLLIIAAFYPTGPLSLIDFGVFVGGRDAVAWWLNKRRTVSFWPYILIAGVLSWIGFYRGGLHPALALVPIIPFLPHAARDPGLFVESPSRTTRSTSSSTGGSARWTSCSSSSVSRTPGVVVQQRRRGNLVRADRDSDRQACRHSRRNGVARPLAVFAAEGRHLARSDRGRHHCRHRLHRRAVLRDGRFPYGRLLDETKLGALLSFALLHRPRRGAGLLKVGRYWRG